MAQFSKLQDFNCYMKSLNSHGILNEYCLLLSPEVSDLVDLSYWRLRYDVNMVVILVGCNICGREEEDSIVLPKEVECLFIFDCNDVRNISNIPTFNTLERLEILNVQRLSNLTGILLNVSETSPAGQYSLLKFVRIYGCHKLKKLISSKLMLELKNLEQIDVKDCTEMEELIAVDDNEERSQKEFLLPKLKRLSLDNMPKLKSICSCNGVMVCDSLQVIFLSNCPKLKKILSSSSKLQLGILKNLEEIKVKYCGEMEEIIAIDDVDLLTADKEDKEPPVDESSIPEDLSREEESSESASNHEEKILKAIEGPEKLPDLLTLEQKEDMLEMALGQNLDEFKKMTIELANTRDNEKLNDENEAIILLNSLPKSFKDVKATIKYGRSSLTLEECISALKSKNLELKIERKDNGENLFARGR
ncbi:hypothetical protein EZV62_019463 [Acer yangbiense]|uniref:Disease resistance protein At4g27190-like leucine-rich repeats domain-containing protein n=1 Tax=Acer yangbiense TaxID=1000413 RepID=A0A5C7HBB5_9ROSI|nr:hypothetical protein EZV62_019463 [Acer yangbiense]